MNNPNGFKITINVYSIHLELRMALIPFQLSAGKSKYVNPCQDFLIIPDQCMVYVKRQVRSRWMDVLLCPELVCITVKWTWYNGLDIFFHITPGRINTWKGLNQLKEIFFLHLFFLDIYIWNWQTKMGFCCKMLSLNDLTPSPISQPGTMTASQRACKPVMTTRTFPQREPASRLGPVLEERGLQTGLDDAWVSFHPRDVVNLAW